MTIFARLDQWRQREVLSSEQHSLLTGLARGEPFSVFLELNLLLYGGVIAFVAGLGWTVSKWSQQLGDVVVLTFLSAILVASLWYCFSRAPRWSPQEVDSPSLLFDYVLYLGSLTWTIELAYIEQRLRLLSGQWDDYLLATACLFFFLAYRFDNRFVLSLALSSLAGWFGLTFAHAPAHYAAYRPYAIVYGLIVVGVGTLLRHLGIKAHFFSTYLNVASNVLFWAVLSGVFGSNYVLWFFALLVLCAASLAWGLKQRQFSFVAYAAVYGYIGISSILLRDANSVTGIMGYFFVTGTAMVIALVLAARRFGRET